MELGPLSVYAKGVQAVPAIRYGFGVAGVIAVAMIAYNIANGDPRKAILAFVFALAGMYLLLIFASVADLKETYKERSNNCDSLGSDLTFHIVAPGNLLGVCVWLARRLGRACWRYSI